MNSDSSALAQRQNGNTSLDSDEMEGLRPTYITTHKELNEAEAANIAKACRRLKASRTDQAVALANPEDRGAGGRELAWQLRHASVEVRWTLILLPLPRRFGGVLATLVLQMQSIPTAPD